MRIRLWLNRTLARCPLAGYALTDDRQRNWETVECKHSGARFRLSGSAILALGLTSVISLSLRVSSGNLGVDRLGLRHLPALCASSLLKPGPGVGSSVLLRGKFPALRRSFSRMFTCGPILWGSVEGKTPCIAIELPTMCSIKAALDGTAKHFMISVLREFCGDEFRRPF
jgi:hypothetical protein